MAMMGMALLAQYDQGVYGSGELYLDGFSCGCLERGGWENVRVSDNEVVTGIFNN